MDSENNGKPYEQIDDFGVPLFSETPKWMDGSLVKDHPFFFSSFFHGIRFGCLGIIELKL